MTTTISVETFRAGELSQDDFELFWKELGEQLISEGDYTMPEQRLEAVKDMLDLSRTEIILLCYALMYKDTNVDSDIIEVRYNLSGYDILETERDLVDKGLFRAEPYIFDIQPTAMAILYQKYLAFFGGIKSIDEIVTYIQKEASPDFQHLDNLVQKVMKYCSRYARTPFCKAFLKLALKLDSDDATGMLILLINNFLETGIAPQTPNGRNYSDVGMSKLIQEGLATVITDTKPDSDEKISGYILTSEVVHQLFEGQVQLFKYESIMEFCNYIKRENIREKTLYFDASKEMDLIKPLFCAGAFAKISRKLKEQGVETGVTVLLYGPSGTGKTESVYQLSRNVHDIFYCDVSRIINSHVGESEKAIRKMFMAYRYLYCMSSLDNVPVLLFNEGEAVCGKRIEVHSSCDKLDNQIINLFLEELERFDGFLVMTTNLPGAMDDAFMRRFTFKLKLDKPSRKTREKIIKASIPGLSPKQAKIISDQYDFTGGNIANISKKVSYHNAVFGVMPDTNTIIEYCREESLNIGSAVPRKKIKGLIEYC